MSLPAAPPSRPIEKTTSNRTNALSKSDSNLPVSPNLSTESAEPQTIVLDITGMMCAGCVSTVEKKLAQCDGVLTATVNLLTEVAALECLPQADGRAIAQALTDAGYPSTLRQANITGLSAESDWLAKQEQDQQNQISRLAIASILLAFSVLGHLQHFDLRGPFSTLLTLPVITTLWFHGTLATLTLLFPARKILVAGFQGLRRGTPNMNTLVSLGALSAYLTSLTALLFPQLGWECFFDEPVMLLSFILLGRTLEQRARFQSAGSLRSLIALQPPFARLVPQPTLPKQSINTATASLKVPVNQVKVGEWLQVLPGEKVPVDGMIALGETSLDESMLTGESMLVSKQPQDTVFAGTLNQSGAITLQVTRTGAETTLGQMIQLVETAQTRKAPIQGLADIISGYFTYGVLVCSGLTFCFWYFVGMPLWPEVAQLAMGHAHMHTAHMPAVGDSLQLLVSLKLAIAVVVVACPCALGLATPTAILVGSGIGAEKGLLIRGGDILEATQKIDTLVFDKTGTLTTGSPQVVDCISFLDELSEDQLLQLAATVESGTCHPLAVAIQSAAAQKQLPTLNASNFQTRAGSGISAVIESTDCSNSSSDQRSHQTIALGNKDWLAENGCSIDASVDEMARDIAKAGKTVVFLTKEHQLIGLISVADQLRSETTNVLSELKSMGISIQILSGDSSAAVRAIAQQLGLDLAHVQAEVKPAEKLSAITALQAAGHQVGLIGDGINDAPALAKANVGIALNSGSEVAIATADIILINNNLTDVLTAIKLSQATLNKIRQNLAWAFSYNLICIPLAAGALLPAFGIFLNPGFAGGLMAVSSVAVVLNSLSLKLGRAY
ncbi:copper-translocating P-type ATPase [Synechococcus sp. PCC 7335]|uniref:heavy metal translocating P-type ATPase n=1 Tax=Synechococcus sp. (strain ATCC 29403 / PCC 7335) TaxID=91464 RepID=UPI00017ED268|nr:heavy metal translocating P-type ATPase [Synechococcus sp. PCC 7335]EDX85646.1 copper-translocating P-type ATPase [Synechococcus sp. PCC 7335]